MSEQPNVKRIFVLEDIEKLLQAYMDWLTERGFYVMGAKNLDEAEQVLQSGENFDLLLLDMMISALDSRAGELNITGADIGTKFKNKQSVWPPEVIAITGHPDVIDFWRKAVDINAVFLEKGRVSLAETITYIRALLLHREVKLDNPRYKKIIRRILHQSGTEFEMLATLVGQVLVPECDACLGTPFIIALEHLLPAHSVDREPHNQPLSSEGLQAEIAGLIAKAYDYLQRDSEVLDVLQIGEPIFELAALPQGKYDAQIFFSSLLTESALSDCTVRGLLTAAAFLPVELTPNIRLSLLILKDTRDKKAALFSEEPQFLAKLLKKHTLSTLRMTLTQLLERWVIGQETKEVQEAELARFCQYVGNETRGIIFGMEAEEILPETSKHLRRLSLLANELSEAGDFLSNIGQKHAPYQNLMLREIIQEAWDSLRPLSVHSSSVLLLHGDCDAMMTAVKEELLFIFSRLLYWLVSLYDEEIDMPPRIVVNCRLDGRFVEVSLESDSSRLHRILRDSIFVPMTQPVNYDQLLETKGPKLFLALYLAKTILEKRYKGSLTDISDELLQEAGHKLVLRMPVINS